MATVWKYPLPSASEALEVPYGAKFLHVAEQHGSVMTWWEVNPTAPPQARRLAVVATGMTVPLHGTHLATWLMDDGALVFHLYELAD